MNDIQTDINIGFTIGWSQESPELAPMFWDSRAESLEEHALLPMFSKKK